MTQVFFGLTMAVLLAATIAADLTIKRKKNKNQETKKCL